MTRKSMVIWAALLAALAVSPIGVEARGAQAAPARAAEPAGVNGPLVVLYGHGGLGQPGPTEGQILTVQSGRVVRVLARGLPYPFMGGLAPSPRGRYVAYGAGVEGLSIVTPHGAHNRRLLAPPRSAFHNTLGIGPVAWSPDRYTLAYVVQIFSDVAFNEYKDRALGIWLARYDAPHPRLLVRPVGLGIEPSFAIRQLSWSPDGRTLLVSTFRPVTPVGQKGPAGATPVILAVDVASGRTRLLVSGAQDAAYAPSSGRLAFVTGEAPHGMTLWTSDVQGGHRRAEVVGAPLISSPAWSPDGRAIAYIAGPGGANGGTEIRVLRGGVSRPLLTVAPLGPSVHPANGQFVSLGWLHTRV